MSTLNQAKEYASLSKKIGTFLSNILLGDTKEIIIRTSVKVDELEKDISEMKHDFEKDNGELKTGFAKLLEKIDGHSIDIQGLKVHTHFGVSHSPTVPNELGKELLEKSQFNTQYPQIQSQIFSIMDKMNLRTLYDYEQGAIDALYEMKNDPAMDPIKDYVVNNPDQPLGVIFKIASWVIRDDYKKYKETQ